MAGIAGFISSRRDFDVRSTVEAMVQTMCHEPSYTSGSLTIEPLQFGGGWVCHRGAFADCLPIWNEARDICLIFSGEEFADRSDLYQLQAAGHAFKAGNASYLVHRYEEKGMACFAELNGVFSGVVIDLKHKKVVLFNDRYGLGRVYYHQNAEGFYFASEAKALLKVSPELRRLDLQGFGEFFASACVLQNRTLFTGVSLLPVASAWTLNLGGSVCKESYFGKQRWEAQPQISIEDYYAKLKTTFARVLPRYFGDNEQIAMSLTGGLDSRMIMAWLPEGNSRLHCYTHTGAFRECADARVARRVAQVCQQPHRLVTVNGEFFPQFPELARRTVYLTDGTMDVSGAAGLFANRVARNEIAPVRITGNYGGQVLRGIVALNPTKLANPIFSRDFSPFVEQGFATLQAERRDTRASLIAFKQMPWLHYARFAMESSQWTIRSPFLDNDLVALAYQAPAELSVNRKLAVRLIADGNPALVRFPTDRGPLGRSGVLGRIGERYQEFTFKAEYAYDYGMPQWLTKTDRILSPFRLERLFLGRHKYYHYRLWYRNQLSSYVRDVLLDPRSLARPYLDRRRVEAMVEAHVSGRGNYTTEIHTLLTAELIHRELIERN